jgi:GH15 family glucan-1,4-alpha-glucosidase
MRMERLENRRRSHCAVARRWGRWARVTVPQVARLEDYAIIGDRETAALVARGGAIEWLCWPRFDSGACFAALLGTADNGRWWLGARDSAARIRRRYRDRTLIIETDIETADGAAMVIDFMPPRGKASDVVRLVQGRRGSVAMRTELIIRFDFGAVIPWVSRLEDGTLRAIAGPDMVVLRTPAALTGRDRAHVGDFTVKAGETVPFVLTYGPSHLPPPARIDPIRALQETETYWRQWSSRCDPGDEWS